MARLINERPILITNKADTTRSIPFTRGSSSPPFGVPHVSSFFCVSAPPPPLSMKFPLSSVFGVKGKPEEGALEREEVEEEGEGEEEDRWDRRDSPREDSRRRRKGRRHHSPSR